MEWKECMSNVEAAMKQLLTGQSVSVNCVDAVSDIAESTVPKTKFNVTYIVAGVLFNEKEEVLMMQEAKKSCYGEWYLPAGRVEPGENLKDAVIREVKEETGLECEPTTLLALEFGGGHWYRFTFTGRVTGGKLKTKEEKDAESIQAQWLKIAEVKHRHIPLRCSDIIRLIETGLHHRKMSPAERPLDLMPAIQAHTHMIMRCVIVHSVSNGDLNVLFNKKGSVHVPSASIAPRDFSVDVCIFRLLKNAFSEPNLSDYILDTCGLLSVEHCGIPKGQNDGICLTLLVSLTSKCGSLGVALSADYVWCPLQDTDLFVDVKNHLSGKKLVTFFDLHK